MDHLSLSYVMPLCSSTPRTDLAPYLRALADLVDVVVVDGSEPEIVATHRSAWPDRVRHVDLPADRRTPMGKVGGVLHGLELAVHDKVVIADDDVTWTGPQLAAVTRLLEHAEIVRPQNHFDPLPWHARWDTGRILVNRVVGGDWPGTLAVRRDVVLDAGGYAGDVMFENLELVRTVRRAGGREHVALDLLVRRSPPPVRQFLDQRVRQAYDELARPLRLAAELSLLPTWVLGGRRTRTALLTAVLAVAEAGRRRGGGRAAFPPTAALWAPAWLAERAVTAWLAVGSRLVLGGIPYRGAVLRRAASSVR
jgi:hypothetical protein